MAGLTKAEKRELMREQKRFNSQKSRFIWWLM
jgi:hypothetical protein